MCVCVSVEACVCVCVCVCVFGRSACPVALEVGCACVCVSEGVTRMHASHQRDAGQDAPDHMPDAGATRFLM
jgi:hypothetical protein